MPSTRASGVLLHPSSLPGPYGIGDLGPEAERFVDLLAACGQRWWQMLPIGPINRSGSPYQSYSSYAGNAALISPKRLVEHGLLSAAQLRGYPKLPVERVDFGGVADAKHRLLRRAFAGFSAEDRAFRAFVKAEARWLDDYALFMALKQTHGEAPWYDWPSDLAMRRPAALKRAAAAHAGEIDFYRFEQFVFARQFADLLAHCRAKGVGLIGDLPIFVSRDSADVWARRDLFFLDDSGHPTVVAGVPPDYFSAQGQLWGNPLYRWDVHEREGFAWWIGRLKAATSRFDLVRLDHFRGFEAYWEVPADAPTAARGRWVKAPGAAFLEAVREALGGLPLIAEDLGDITPEVLELRDRFGLPGMRVLQFGFGDDPKRSPHLPHHYVPLCVAYTGTHDNDTAVGWYRSADASPNGRGGVTQAQREFARLYVGSDGTDFHRAMIRSVACSAAEVAIYPLQDVLGLGGEARMNVPGVPEGNWGWRLAGLAPGADAMRWLAEITAATGRWNGETPRLRPRRAAASRERSEDIRNTTNRP